MPATYTKLRSGDWGLKITGEETCEGEIVAVRKKDGSINYETVKHVIFENGAYAICTIAKVSDSGNYSELKEREGHYDRRPTPIPYAEQYCGGAEHEYIE